MSRRSIARPRPAIALAVFGVVVALMGCGPGTDKSSTAAPAATLPPSPLARIALAGPLRSLDPLYARSHAERLVSRQLYAPLVAHLDAPLDLTGSHHGLARPLRPDDGGRDWSFELRPGGRFQDGTPINADAVIANADRWFASGLAGRILPELKAVDSPLPGQVRFQLSAPVPDLPARLADPRLGLIAPETLAVHGTNEIRSGAGASGAYGLAALARRHAVLQAAPGWWGREAGLGPGIDRIDVRAVASEHRRVALLRDGEVEVAEDLGAPSATEIAGDPTLVSTTQGSRVVGASGAVRGLRVAEAVQPLSELWLTTLR